MTGRKPLGCPWRAFTDPVVKDVLRVHRWYESGQVAVRLGSDPPHHLIEGLEVFHTAMDAVDSDEAARRRKRK